MSHRRKGKQRSYRDGIDKVAEKVEWKTRAATLGNERAERGTERKRREKFTSGGGKEAQNSGNNRSCQVKKVWEAILWEGTGKKKDPVGQASAF